jgi:hypothetical protein
MAREGREGMPSLKLIATIAVVSLATTLLLERVRANGGMGFANTRPTVRAA